MNNLPLPASYTFSATAGQFFNNSSYAPFFSSINNDHLLELRRRVYTNSDEMQLAGLWSSDGVVMPPRNQVSPAMFDCYPVMLERVRPWVLRDIAAIAGNGHIQTIADIVLQLLRQFPITSDDFYERLFPYLGLHTRRFLLELDAFARSPFDMTTYDARVVYSARGNAESSQHLSTEHVEDISSGDDSDIELLSPAVVSPNEAAHNSYVSVLTDLLHNVRALQHSLFKSTDMNRRSLNSRLESPVPGPSGLAQHVAAAAASDESDSVGSHASMLAHDGEDRSDSPMILSDADSDIVVIDVSRSVRSPIHISSGEDDPVTRQISARQRIKRRRRHSQHAKKRGCESEQSIMLTIGTEHTEDSQCESHAEKPPGYSVESNAEDLMPAVEQNVSSSHVQGPSSSRCSSVQLNDHSSACSQPSPSKPYEAGKSTDTAMNSLHHRPHLKRSLSTNSISTVSVVSESSSGDVKPLTCKKHVSGHKSSKSKQRVREKRSPEGISGNAKNVFSGSQDGKVIGSRENDEQISADISYEVTASFVGESSAAGQDFDSDLLPVCCTSETSTAKQKLVTDSQRDDGIAKPCVSEVRSLPADSVLSLSMEDKQCSPLATAEVAYDTADQCSPIADKNSVQVNENGCFSCCDVIPMHAVDADKMLTNVANVADEGINMDDHDVETHVASFHSSDSVLTSKVDADDNASAAELLGHRDDSTTTCLPTANLPSLSGPVVTSEYSDGRSESVDNRSVSTVSPTSCNTRMHLHSVRSCMSDNKITGESVDRPFHSDCSSGFPVVQQGIKAQASTNSSPLELFRFFNQDTSCLHTDAASSENLSSESSLLSCNFSSSLNQMSSDCSSSDRRQSAGSTSHGDLVIEENDTDLAVNYSIVIGSPDDSSNSDVEWLETGTLGRQRCISISSSDSSILCSPLDSDDIESFLLDSDSLEIFDSEPQPSQSAELVCSFPTLSQPLSPLNSASLPSTPDVFSLSGDVTSEQVQLEKNPELREAVEASTSTEKFPGNVTVQTDQNMDAFSPASVVDSNVTPTEELAVQQ